MPGRWSGSPDRPHDIKEADRGARLVQKNVKSSGMVDQRRFDKRSKSYGGAA